MAVNLNNVHSPCMMCYIHGAEYFPESDRCQRCEYNIAIKLLKVVLKNNDYCTLCKNCIPLGCGYWDCKITDDASCCNPEKDYIIDWKAAFDEYGIKYNA